MNGQYAMPGAPDMGAQGGIVESPAQRQRRELQEYLMQMGNLEAEEQTQEQALARAQALRGGVGGLEARPAGSLMVAPSWGEALMKGAGNVYGAYKQGQAQQALGAMPGRRAGVPLPGY